MNDTRFTDRQIREYPDLRNIALGYLATYHGEFEPLIEAQRLMSIYSTDEFPIGVIRMVLNTMRSDPSAVQRLPVLAPDPTPSVNQEPVRLQSRRRDEPKRRKGIIDLPTRWKAKYVAATHRSATVYHLIDPRKSFIRLFTGSGKYKVVVSSYCSATLATGVPLLNPPTSRHACAACTKIAQEVADRQAANDAAIAALKMSA